MKLNINKKESKSVQALLWLVLVIYPIMTSILMGNSAKVTAEVILFNIPYYILWVGGFYMSYLVLVPSLLMRKHVVWFFVNVVLTFLGLGLVTNIANNLVHAQPLMLITSQSLLLNVYLGQIVFFTILTIVAVLLRFQERNHQKEIMTAHQHEEQVTAELDRLRNQLNPHFLFNTLNNISALADINTENAQEAISRLSQTLRYVIYQSAEKEVPLESEIEFIHNYVNLMLMRYTDLLHINMSMPKDTQDIRIAPMLFVSLLENAFKYGASSQHDSSIDISIKLSQTTMKFSISNTILPEQEINRTYSSGLGLTNLRKRLELLYPQRYSLDISQKNNIYKATLSISKS